MAYYGQPTPDDNLNFYQSSYAAGVQAHAPPPPQAGYGYGAPTPGPSYGGFGGAAPSGVSGRMGEQGGLRTGWLAALSTEGYEDEPPLLEELGVNFGHIQMKTLTVLNPFARIDQHVMDDADLAGPIIFYILLGTFLLGSGKLHFGYIYGLGLMGSIALHALISLMSPDQALSMDAAHVTAQYSSNDGYPGATPAALGSGGKESVVSRLTFWRSASVLGYCILPLVLTSLVGVVMPLDGPVGYALMSAAIAWCTWSASGMFCTVGRMRGMRGLVAYPVALYYAGFGIMAIFSSKGTGTVTKVVEST